MVRPLYRVSHIRPAPRRKTFRSEALQAVGFMLFGVGLSQVFLAILPKAGPDTTVVNQVAPPRTTYPIRLRDTDVVPLVTPPDPVQAETAEEAPPLPAAITPSVPVVIPPPTPRRTIRRAPKPVAPPRVEPEPREIPRPAKPAPTKPAPTKPAPQIRKAVPRARIPATPRSNQQSEQPKPFQLPSSLLPID